MGSGVQYATICKRSTTIRLITLPDDATSQSVYRRVEAVERKEGRVHRSSRSSLGTDPRSRGQLSDQVLDIVFE